ncbi:tRNA (uridine(54)-C5)-methyltransferase TrmA [Moraxella sp. ZY210820]|uniref:tRNA (uridine(54)-C5)-methyltransferase TrmA n=1 Tax=unclassified Moraxella TaxID=2685852 RepID=UPI00272F36C5|nr:tRNA (uridine(54)-C5)-methyltransferase TrmA [Moraxella sp. ZY210820]WLF84870.1 tRNA (uridine(54)-C5)-methyltransferase TrmA [Moraxella sp. ZY210820]
MTPLNQDYQQQLEQKIQRIQQQFSCFSMPELEIFTSPKQHFRMRDEFRIWHTDDDLFYAMFERNEQGHKKIIRIDEFPIASQMINQLMPILRQELLQQPILSERLFEINFLNSLHGDMLVSLIYHKKLDETWQNTAQQLAQKLNIKIIGRSRGQKIVLSDDFVIEQFNINQHTYQYKQIENGFSQPNARICQQMLHWACDVAGQQTKDLLELYCGNGNFTLPLSRHFRKVLATELAKSSVQTAEWNIEQNAIENIQIARLSAEEFSQAYQGEREFRRLQQAKINIQHYDFNTIFVDPPRAGIDDDTLKLMQNFERIIYISCNPDTLHENLKTLTQTHEIQRFALFDQFPYTHHVESGVFLIKK